jgi:hypothetical protein
METEGKSLPSFDDFVREQAENSNYMSTLPPGEYAVQFLGAEMVNNRFGNISPRYRFNHNGTEKILDSASKKLFALSGREGQTVTIVKGISQDGKTAWSIR